MEQVFAGEEKPLEVLIEYEVGEIRTGLTKSKPNDAKGWTKKETKDYSKTLLPETCENPVYEEKMVPPAGGEWGWTEHTCTTCGYTWRDSYTAP